MKKIKIFLALMGATLLSANALAEEPDYDANGFATDESNPNQYQEPTKIDGVYQIANAGNLYWFANYVNQLGDNLKANAILANDIVVNTLEFKDGEIVTDGKNYRVWKPIGNYNKSFQGTFDGNGKTISGLYYDNSYQNYVGLFGNNQGTIKNVGVVDSYFNGQAGIGGVCGYNKKGSITNCYNTGEFSGNNEVGGVCGYNENGTIENCYNTGEFSGGEYSCNVGGVCGDNYYGTITNCYNTGEVSGNSEVGGVCGYNYGTITNCYNTGEVSGYTEVGGVCGWNYEGTITNCYNTGKVSGSQYFGGVCGDNYNATITNCYYLSDTDKRNDAKTQAQFNNGCVAYLLSQGDNGGVWGQDLSNQNSLPTLYGSKVYETNNKYVNSDNGFLADNNYEEPRKDNNGVYLIANAGNLYWFANYVNDMANAEYKNVFYQSSANAVLTANITVNENLLSRLVKDNDGNVTNGDAFKAWDIIGYYNNYNDNVYVYYAGTFDGNGHTISGLYFNDSNRDCAGLIGLTTEGAVIKNVGVIDSYFKGKYDVGGVCGYNNGGTITNCYNTGEVSGGVGSNSIGGVCGCNYYTGTIENCYNTGEVNGSGISVGGVCGCNYYNGTITNCYNTGEVSGGKKSNEIGGVCGYNFSTIQNCYNTGEVSGGDESSNIGGVCGDSYKGSITNCYNTGVVSGTKKIGGVCGYNHNTITNCYNTGEVSGGVNSEYIGGVCGYNFGTIKNCYYLSDADNENNAKTQEQFNNGCVAYLLSQGDNGGVWGQDLSKDNSLPMLNGSKVYKNTCEDVLLGYSNEDKSYEKHEYENGICKHCGLYQPADINTDGYYEIANAGNLYWFMEYVNNNAVYNEDADAYLAKANAVLVNDITVNKNLLDSLKFDEFGNVANGDDFKAWNPMGYFINNSNDVYYAGTFDGNGHTISGLYFNDPDQDFVGLFGYNKGTIQNVGVVDSYFYGNKFVGGVCGENTEGTIENCYNTGNVNGSCNEVGGVCGCNVVGTIVNCYNTGNVNGSSKEVGGVCGDVGNYCTITNCYNTGEVNGSGDYVGGVCGDVGNYCTITNCYNIGNVKGSGNYVGGVCGENWGTITNCYYLETSANTGIGEGDGGESTAKTAEQFANGTVAKLLFASDSIWGQNTSTDTVPNFSGKIIFTVSVTASGNGTVSGTSGEYEYNSKFAIEATSNKGYHFAEWSNGSAKINDTILVVSDTALVAKFEAHSFGKWDTTLVATCAVAGLRTHACACGEVETDTIAKLAHTVVVDSAKTATCTVAGLTEGKHCSVCDSILVAQQTVPALGHKIVVDSAKTATCTVAGLTEGKHCSVCDSVLVAQQTLPALGHKIVVDSAKTATCTTTGLTEGSHCSVCDSVLVAQQIVAKLAHTVVVDSAKTATCTATGLTEGKHCSVCDSIFVAQQTVPALGHKIVVDSAKTATCTTTGLTEGSHCSVCNSVLVAQQIVAKLAHTVVVDSAKTATCTVAGLTEGKHCSVCGSVLVAQQTVAKIAHTVVVDSAKTATCTVAGLTEGKHCSVCDSVLVAQQTLPALGHKIETIAGVSPTCTAEGLTEGSHCSVCNEIIKAQETIPALGHSFTNYIYNNDATTEADGTETAECDREGCNAIDVRTAEGTKLQTSVGTESAEGVVIYAHHNTIVVENATEDIFIYNADGRCVASRDAACHVSIAMQREGIYIVRTGDKTQRVFVAQN